ncbi:uncharacterized protein LOC110025683 [Phalaenopsis equestris]|uniref:uncharacterized protein LOC110025683 n=1 Tax=Phalaenopsis equestris TaxID=78828 RepID=UPI0009E2392C|nr:uncharacterized protein LOC110025683 [Phalaenopsis equestris]
MATPIDLETNVQWSKATFADVVGKSSNFQSSVEVMATFHEGVGKGELPFVKQLSKKSGKPAALFSEAEINSLSSSFKFTLVGKFQYGHPKMEAIRKYFEDLKLLSDWKVRLIDGRHFSIHLSREEDYTRLFAKQILYIEGMAMKLLKWPSEFDPSQEPPILPTWFKLPGLKHHFFHHQVLFTIGIALGRPMKIDVPTYNLSRLSAARILVERDITLPEVDEIWLGTAHNGSCQKIVMEQKTYYCTHCKMFGHSNTRCFKLHPNTRTNTKLQEPTSVPAVAKEQPVGGVHTEDQDGPNVRHLKE